MEVQASMCGRCSIEVVTKNGETELLSMDPDLMGSSGVQFTEGECVLLDLGEDPESASGGLAVRGTAKAPASGWVPSDGRVDFA